VTACSGFTAVCPDSSRYGVSLSLYVLEASFRSRQELRMVAGVVAFLSPARKVAAWGLKLSHDRFLAHAFQSSSLDELMTVVTWPIRYRFSALLGFGRCNAELCCCEQAHILLQSFWGRRQSRQYFSNVFLLLLHTHYGPYSSGIYESKVNPIGLGGL
jgi:hypothetical protein